MKYLEIPLGLIYSVTRLDISPFEDVLIITTKDNRKVALKLGREQDQEDLESYIKNKAFSFKVDSDASFMSYKYEPRQYLSGKNGSSSLKSKGKILDTHIDDHLKLPATIVDDILKDTPLDINGWDVYDFEEEFIRQGVNVKEELFQAIETWRDNEENTYPRKAFIPSDISHGDAFSAFEFRSRKRFPALSYYFYEKGTSLWRCAQPCVGFFNSRNNDDEKLFKAIKETCPNNKGLLIVDARSYVAASGNRITGGGTEN
mmetsp:Transcript_11181/g.11142  ORF Transcript_11181/g.11142 Transcript_11181/m.11142 type:complete len:259 (+) Transcript_11181:217-993(+)|eukprot:CAMPEP_0197016974 /NCGR_PEP_ID=MMETSP1380-20130617/79279_1 /TAXON_ID=5936 /ORGANISM="Euplotes crassus, Strain CT5" /LENGTH=258 /DNA_ID=CAMNT_0042444013 /DNA_START=162 /DNA_END=938 /DNA_ORIENTATION=+